jgi:uncharacterized membrane protein
MTRRTYVIVSAVILAIVGICAITLDRLWILVVGVVCATGLSIILRRARKKEVAKDERTTYLYEKAAGATLRLTLPLAAIGSLVLLLVKDRLSNDATQLAYVLSYAVSILLLVHLAFYWYYSRKH